MEILSLILPNDATTFIPTLHRENIGASKLKSQTSNENELP